MAVTDRFNIICVGVFADGKGSKSYQIGEVVEDIVTPAIGEEFAQFEDKNWPCDLESARNKLGILRRTS